MNNKIITPTIADEPMFISLILHLYGGRGHVLSYQTALYDAIQNNSWGYMAIVSENQDYSCLPKSWSVRSVDDGILDFDGETIKKCIKLFRLDKIIKSIYKNSQGLNDIFISMNNSKKEDYILFLETFNPLQLFVLYFALKNNKKNNLSLWIMYRGGPKWGKKTYWLFTRISLFLFRISNYLFKTILDDKHYILLTDTELLQKSLSSYFQKSVKLLPIPHTVNDTKQIHERKTIDLNLITCWWPGSPRLEKGLRVIEGFSNTADTQDRKIELFVANNADIGDGCKNVHLIKLQENLSREQYEKQFLTCDFVLLPYDSDLYEENSSGIFVEAIIYGAIPIVASDTWMAYELVKYNLNELVLGENNKLSIDLLYGMNGKAEVLKKLDRIRYDYIKFHNVANYSYELKKIYLSNKNNS